MKTDGSTAHGRSNIDNRASMICQASQKVNRELFTFVAVDTQLTEQSIIEIPTGRNSVTQGVGFHRLL